MSRLFDHSSKKQKNKKRFVCHLSPSYCFYIFQDYYILFSVKIKEHCSHGKGSDGKVVEMRRRRGSDRENEGEKCEDGECVKSSEEKEQGRKKERMTEAERVTKNAQGTMAQKSTQTKTTVET